MITGNDSPRLTVSPYGDVAEALGAIDGFLARIPAS